VVYEILNLDLILEDDLMEYLFGINVDVYHAKGKKINK
jgi:hypothetical protein